jgi:hypothetical protein
VNDGFAIDDVKPEIDQGEEAPAAPTAVAEPPAPEQAEPEKADTVPEMEKIEPSDEPKPWLLVLHGQAAEYTQAPLSFFRKIEFFSLVGDTLAQAMEGEDGLTVVGMLNSIGGSMTPSLEPQDLQNADSFVAGLARLTSHVPDFLKDCYCIWLNIPKKERAWAREAMDGLNDAEGVEIIETFIDQNADALEDFFRETAPRLVRKAAQRFGSES